MIIIKSDREIEIMSFAGKILSQTHELLKKSLKIGITTKELDKIAEDFIKQSGCTPSFKGYHGYPASICASINEEVIHGIPSDRTIKNGDVLGIDIGVCYKGYHADAARSYVVGEGSEISNKLVRITKECFFEGLKHCYAGKKLSDISSAIQIHAEKNGFSLVREFTGHGIGSSLHEDPPIPNYGKAGRGPILEKGMALAIEPMLNVGDCKVMILDDDWTVITKDKKNSAHYENTVIITDGEPLVITLAEGEDAQN